jgi:hypothetical protein
MSSESYEDITDSWRQLVDRVDLDGLVRLVDDTVSDSDWKRLVRIRDACTSAVKTGRQVWPIATLANYRLALWAPAEFACRALDDSLRTFMPGPTSEILAVHHSWADLSPHLDSSPDRSLVAHERALRGDVIDSHEFTTLDMPFALQSWEPAYDVPTYTDDGGQFPAPPAPATTTISTTSSECIDDPETTAAFRLLVEPWTASSNGRADIAIVEGDGLAAMGALGMTDARRCEVDSSLVLRWLVWAASSGGAHGRRRGRANGRSLSWWFLHQFFDLGDSWPTDPDELGARIAGLTCHLWDMNEPLTGWSLQLTIDDSATGLACAIHAKDAA